MRTSRFTAWPKWFVTEVGIALAIAFMSTPLLHGAGSNSEEAAPPFEAQGPSEGVEHFEEDEERIRHHWETAMTPEEYRNALEATGMSSAMSRPLAGSGWESTGPVGGIMTDSGQAFGGRIAALQIFDDVNGFWVYAGGSSGGLWRAHSSDGVGRWESIGDNLPNPSARAFSVDPTQIADIVVGTGDLNRFGGSGMYRTIDGGASWSQITLPIPAPAAFGRILRSPTNPDLLVACGISGGVLRSTDGGTTWSVTLNGSVNDIIANPANFNIQYAAKDNAGAFKSTDGGATWTQMSVTLPVGVDFTHGYLAVCRDAPQNVGLFLSQGEFQVFRSTNSGTTWSNITGTLGQPNEGSWHMAEFGHTGAIAFRPTDPNEIYIGARGPQRTTNNGATWDDVFATHADITQLHFNSESGDNVLWICCDGGILTKTIGGGSQGWNGDAATGLRCFQIDRLDSKRSIRAIGTQDNGAHYTTNAGATWLFSGGGDAWDCEIVNDLAMEIWHADGVYGAPDPGIIVHRRRAGSFTDTNNTAEGMDGLFYNRYLNWMYSIGDDDLIYGCNLAGSPLAWVAEGQVPADFATGRTPTGSYVNGMTMYSNTSSGPKIAIADRSAGHWIVSTHDFGGSGAVASIYPSTENAGEVWVTMRRSNVFQPLIYHSRDFGGSWTDVTGNLSSLKTVRCIVNKPFEPHHLFAGTDIGVFESFDGGGSWLPLQSGLPIAPCTDMRYVVDPDHGGSDKLVVATYGRGIYECYVFSYPIVYVHKDTPSSTEDGTYDHPYDTFTEGSVHLPAGGSLALYGDTYSTGPTTLTTPMTLRAYGGAARFGQ